MQVVQYVESYRKTSFLVSGIKPGKLIQFIHILIRFNLNIHHNSTIDFDFPVQNQTS